MEEQESDVHYMDSDINSECSDAEHENYDSAISTVAMVVSSIIS